jgi:hypothetical protein
MKLDWDKPLETTDGLPVIDISRPDGRNERACYIERIGWLIFTQDGLISSCVSGPLKQLRNRKVKKSGWVNIYPPSMSSRIADSEGIYESEDKAIRLSINAKRLATVEVEWEE